MPTLSSQDIGINVKTTADNTGLNSAGKSIQGLGDHATAMGVVIGGVAGIVSNVFNRAVTAVTDTIGAAISRVDTLGNASRAFENMGFSVSETTKMMTSLKTSILGLPTSLNDAVGSVELLSGSMGDVGKSQKVFSAMNDAILGFGGTAIGVQGAVVQLSQAFSNGRVDAQTWNSLIQNGMGPALNAMAKQMGITTGALKNGLSTGTISVEQFQASLMDMDTKGGGGMASFQKIVKDSTSGIATGMANANTSITRGVADIIQSIGSKNISDAISTIGTAFEQMLKSVSVAVTGIIGFIVKYKDILAPLAVSIGTVVAAMLIFNAVMAIQATMQAFSVLSMGVGAFLQLENTTKLATAAQWLLNIALDANPISLIIIGIAALIAGLIFFFTQTQLGKEVFANVMKFIGVAMTAVIGFFKSAWETISAVWGAVTKFFTDIGNSIMDIFNGVVSFFESVGAGIAAVFNGVVDFFKKWGPTILAILFWPFALVLGLIIKNWGAITGFFKFLVAGIVAVFTPIVQFITGIFKGAWNAMVFIWNFIVGYYTTLFTILATVFTTVGKFISSVFVNAWNMIVSIWNRVGTFFGSVWTNIVTVFTPVVAFFGNIFMAAWGAIKNVFGAVGGFFAGVWGTIVSVFSGIGTAVGNAIGGAFRGVMNSILKIGVDAINTVIGALDTAIDIINNIPNVHIPKINQLSVPHFATGVQNFSGGMALVGEQGPELVNLPQGSNVIPNKQSNAMMKGGGGNHFTHIGDVYLGSKSAVQEYFTQTDRDTLLLSKGLSAARGSN